MQFAEVNGVTLHYQVIGAAEGAPLLVFSNSLGTDFRIWRDVIVRFVGECAILVYDKRGHGLSDTGDAPYSIDDHVADLAALLDHLGRKEAIVCGLSVGGLIAQGLAVSRPDLVQALILCDTAHKIGTDEKWNQRIDAIHESGMELDRRRHSGRLVHRRLPRDAGVPRLSQHADPPARRRLYRHLRGGARRRLHRIDRPARPAGHLRGRRGGRLDAARPRASDGEAHPERALRGDRGCRPYRLRRAAGQAGRRSSRPS